MRSKDAAKAHMSYGLAAKLEPGTLLIPISGEALMHAACTITYENRNPAQAAHDAFQSSRASGAAFILAPRNTGPLEVEVHSPAKLPRDHSRRTSRPPHGTHSPIVTVSSYINAKSGKQSGFEMQLQLGAPGGHHVLDRLFPHLLQQALTD